MENSDDLTVGDLLSLFQGPGQVEGQLIFATTNRFEHIKEICPALIRPGRLTPVHFENIDKESLCDLMFHFFEMKIAKNDLIKEFKFCKKCCKTTSEIILKAIEFQEENNIGKFLKYVNMDH